MAQGQLGLCLRYLFFPLVKRARDLQEEPWARHLSFLGRDVTIPPTENLKGGKRPLLDAARGLKRALPHQDGAQQESIIVAHEPHHVDAMVAELGLLLRHCDFGNFGLCVRFCAGSERGMGLCGLLSPRSCAG